MNYKNGKGFGPTKNNKNRTIKMDKETMNIFEKLFEEIPTNILELVFYNPNTKSKVVTNSAVNKALGKTLKDLKIDSITIHGLRHTHASVLLYKKVSINYVSERLGHKDTQTTYKYYSHILNEMRKEDESTTVKIFEKELSRRIV